MTEINHKPEEEKFYIEDKGVQARLCYSSGTGYLDIYEVYVSPELRGRGYAKEITTHVLEYAMQNGLKVKPSCPYVDMFMKRNRKKYGELNL